MIITKKTAMRNNTRSARGHIIAAVAGTRKGIQKRQLVHAVQAYRHSPKTKQIYTQGRIAQAQTRGLEAQRKAAERRAQEESARARAELLRRQAQEEAERRKRAKQEVEEARRREQERRQKEAEEARQKELERQRREAEEAQAREMERKRKEAEEARRREEEKQRQKEKEYSETTQKSLDTSRLQMSRRRFIATYQRHAVEGPEKAVDYALRASWDMDWKSAEEAQEYTVLWISELGFPNTPQSREYIAYYGAGGPVHMEALRQVQEPGLEEESPAR